MFETEKSALTPGFMVVHANLPEQLRALIVQWTKAYPLQVLETETILVQSNGIAQWLQLALAADPDPSDASLGGAGIAAGLSLQMPGRFIWQLYRWVLATETIPEHSAFDKNQLRWRLIRLLPTLCAQPEFAVIAAYLQDDQAQRKLQQLAFKLADLFDQYQVYRADWLQAWALSKSVLLDPQGQAQALAPEQQWQAALWRAILADVAPEERPWSRASLHQRFLQAAAGFNLQQRPAGLPRRVIVFGVSSLPSQVLEALAAIAPYTQILLAVHNPCRHYWADIVPDTDLLKAEQQRQRRKVGMPIQLTPEQIPNHAQPLLAAWGKQGRDYIRLLDEFDQTQQHRQLFVGDRIDLFHQDEPEHLLAQLQNDVLELRSVAESQRHWPVLQPWQAQSLCFATAHSPLREIEVLQDDLLAQFAADPSLRPSDVMVMMPDIQVYAAAISAVFGRISRDDPRYIPFVINDQSMLQQAPLLQALQTLLTLPTQRFTVSTVLDLLQLPAIQHRFGISASDLPQLKRWIEAAHIRWGLHSTQRQSFDLPADFSENSWQHGLQRMLLGYAMGQTQPWQDIAPCAEVSGLAAALAGQLAQFLASLDRYWQQSRALHTAAVWAPWLAQLINDFFSPQTTEELFLINQLKQALYDWLAQCERAGLQDEIELALAASGWLEPFASQGLSQRFFAGAVNFATLMPMRAIPFAQIHLLGMNDGDFPRATMRQDFDLMQGHYRPGDRSRRDDDRYLMLEALLSARQRLRISWIGRSVHDNSERAPSVLVGQLRDHLASIWQVQLQQERLNGKALLAFLTTEHPLQPFSPRYLEPSSGLFSYQHEWGALHQPEPASQHAPALLPLPEVLPLFGLHAVSQWLKDPVRFFFQQRLQIRIDPLPDSEAQTEPFSLEGLDRWQLQQRLVHKLQAQMDKGLAFAATLTAELQQLQTEGVLPVAAAGQLLCTELQQLLEPQAQRYAGQVSKYPQRRDEPLWCQYSLDSITVGDWLQGLRIDGAVGYVTIEWHVGALYKEQQLDYRALFLPWLKLLFAAQQGEPLQALLLGSDTELVLPAISRSQAQLDLAQLCHWLQRSFQQPLPVELGCALTLLQAEIPVGVTSLSGLDDKMVQQLNKRLQGDGFRPGVLQQNRYLQRAYADLAALWQDGACLEAALGIYQPLRQYIVQAGIPEKRKVN